MATLHWKGRSRHPRRPRAMVLTAVGLPGILALSAQPLPDSLFQQHPELVNIPVWALKAMGVINPALLLAAAAWVGVLVAHRVGLRSILAGTADNRAHGSAWLVAAATGLATGCVLVACDALLAPWLGSAWQQFLQGASTPSLEQLLVGVLYGGITEEILMRWGLMSAFAWVLWRLGGQREPAVPVAVAGVLAALVFGAAHLPALGAQVEMTPGIALRTLGLNAMAALMFGWVFWRHHLEAAMLCHACSHVAMGILWALA